MKTINGVAGDLKVPAKPGQQVRVRVTNTDNGPIESWADTPFRVLAIDGYEVNSPTDVTDRSVTITAGGRADLGITMPSDGRGVRVQVSKGTACHSGCRRSVGPAATGNRPRSTELRKPDRAELRPSEARSTLRLLNRPPTRLRAWPPRALVVDQRASLSAQCRCTWSVKATS